MRISGLEPLNYQPDAANMRSTFLNIGERCNVAGSILFKKSIIDGNYDKALDIALKQVCSASPSCLHCQRCTLGRRSVKRQQGCG